MTITATSYYYYHQAFRIPRPLALLRPQAPTTITSSTITATTTTTATTTASTLYDFYCHYYNRTRFLVGEQQFRC